MPYPAQVSAETILQKASDLLIQEGFDSFSLGKLAGALGIKTPSLYRYYASKTDLFRAINQQTAAHLTSGLQAAVSGEGEAVARLLAMGNAYRQFAQANPVLYRLLYAYDAEDVRLAGDLAEHLAQPLQVAMSALSGGESSLPALRGAWALIHGFVMLELNGQFQRGGSLDDAFQEALTAYLKGWQR